jgi:predicted Rossmann fold nucleotide-binding protein DprA/Smf involved in DNA uptake
MKVLICGSRGIKDPAVLLQAVEQSGMTPRHIISGGARGVDHLAREYAAAKGIEFTEYLADWDRYGKRAGFVRNCVMVGAADAVIAVWDGSSPGTKHSIEYARSCGKQVFVYLHTTAQVRKVTASAN